MIWGYSNLITVLSHFRAHMYGLSISVLSKTWATILIITNPPLLNILLFLFHFKLKKGRYGISTVIILPHFPFSLFPSFFFFFLWKNHPIMLKHECCLCNLCSCLYLVFWKLPNHSDLLCRTIWEGASWLWLGLYWRGNTKKPSSWMKPNLEDSICISSGCHNQFTGTVSDPCSLADGQSWLYPSSTENVYKWCPPANSLINKPTVIVIANRCT